MGVGGKEAVNLANIITELKQQRTCV